MSSHPPPVPPEQRSPKAPDAQSKTGQGEQARSGPNRNTAEQGRQGNIHQNTTNKGFQQDR